jgi:hypothetical protein
MRGMVQNSTDLILLPESIINSIFQVDVTLKNTSVCSLSLRERAGVRGRVHCGLSDN